MENTPRLLFVTTSLGTKWESYSQSLIEVAYPESARLVVDGTQNWFPLMFLEPALAHDSDYIIHIDEDCFLFDSGQLDQLVQYLNAHEDIVMAGIPDGGNYYREHNPYACNLFFLIFKTKAIRELLNADPEWRSRKFNQTFRSGEDLDESILDQSRIKFDDYEPYYGSFWAILGSGKRIAYLNSSVDPTLLSTDVTFASDEGPMTRHMWYLRSWNRADLSPNGGITHRARYRLLEKQIISQFGTDPRFRHQLRRENSKRVANKLVKKAMRIVAPSNSLAFTVTRA